MRKILLCGLKYDKNFGDPIINDCTKFLINSELKKNKIDYEFDEFDLVGRCDKKNIFDIKNTPNVIFKRILKRIITFLRIIFGKINLKKISDVLEYYEWNLSKQRDIYDRYLKNKVKNNDAIIIVGGGLVKYKYDKFYLYIDYITKCATKYNKPVFFNSVGVEGYDENNHKCKILKNALNRNCVKFITTRDDFDCLKKYILNQEIYIAKVSDPAVYVSQVYDIQKKYSDIVGICLCRKNLFVDNDVNFTGDDLNKLFKNIIDSLDMLKIKWNLYTNGVDSDNEFAKEFVKKNNIPSDKLIIPSSSKELVEIISNFRCIIATRLHSCIVSYSMNIPSIGLVWNNKLKLFGECINYRNRFFDMNDVNSNKIIECIRKIWNQTYENTDGRYKEQIIVSIKKIFKILGW